MKFHRSQSRQPRCNLQYLFYGTFAAFACVQIWIVRYHMNKVHNVKSGGGSSSSIGLDAGAGAESVPSLINENKIKAKATIAYGEMRK